MSEVVSNEAFFAEIATLGDGEVGHHSMVFPGVYPSDRASHEGAKQGRLFEPTSPFFAAVGQARDNGARLEWLRVLPKPGEFGYDKLDVAAMHRTMGVIARVGFDVRTVNYSDHISRMIEQCGEDSPVVADYLAGLERGDPRKSSWATFRRRQAGRLAIAYFDTMDYQDGEFLGHRAYGRLVDEQVARWAFLWRETYKNYGEPVSPLSS